MPQAQQSANSSPNKSNMCQEFDTCQKLVIGIIISIVLILLIIISIRCYIRKYRKQKQLLVQIRPINVSNLLRMQLSQSLALKSLQDQSDQQQKGIEEGNISQNEFKNSEIHQSYSYYQDNQNQDKLEELTVQKSLAVLPQSRILSNEFQSQRNAIKNHLQQRLSVDVQNQELKQHHGLSARRYSDNELAENVEELQNKNIHNKYNTIQFDPQNTDKNSQITKSEKYITKNYNKIIPTSSSVYIPKRKKFNNFYSNNRNLIDNNFQIPEIQE